MTLPGTYERCMSGHYYAVVRGDEECSACKALEAAKLREAELTRLVSSQGIRAMQDLDNIETLAQERNAALSALGMLYDKWENGDPCYEDPEELSGSLGNAFKLSLEEKNSILALLKGAPSSAALAERDRAIERKTAERCKAIAEQRGERDETNESCGAIDVEYGALCVADLIDREFNLEPKTGDKHASS